MKDDVDVTGELLQQLKTDAQFVYLPDTDQLTITFNDIDQKLAKRLLGWSEDQDFAKPSTEFLLTESLRLEITQNPLFKPKNPSLAILQVAKLHGLSAERLGKAYKEYQTQT